MELSEGPSFNEGMIPNDGIGDFGVPFNTGDEEDDDYEDDMNGVASIPFNVMIDNTSVKSTLTSAGRKSDCLKDMYQILNSNKLKDNHIYSVIKSSLADLSQSCRNWNERHLYIGGAVLADGNQDGDKQSKTFFPVGSHGDKGRDSVTKSKRK